jgi:hypothetical protein
VLFQSPAMFLTPAIEAATTIGASAHVARRSSFSRRNEAISFSEHKTAKQLRVMEPLDSRHMEASALK